MTTEHIMRLIACGQEHSFYVGSEWKRMAEQVKRQDRYECQLCKARGRYRRGSIVHHIKHLKDRPDLALSMVDPSTGERQLITLCKECHEAQHPEALVKRSSAQNGYINAERWE